MSVALDLGLEHFGKRAAIGAGDAFRHCHHATAEALAGIAHVGEEAFDGEGALRHVDEMRTFGF
mgnify:CR=1 FL=1